MKRLIILAAALMSCLCAFAQREVFLFPDFQKAHIVFYNNATSDVELNIDTYNQVIYYIQGEQLMQMTNMQSIGNLTVGDRRFVIHDGLLCEAVDVNGRPVLVNWKFKNVNKGSKGALGATTQNKVEVLWTNLEAGTVVPGEGRAAQQGDYVLEVWQMKSDNTYFISVDGRDYRVKKLKDLYKAFPDVAPQLKAFAKENHLLMTSAEDSFKIFRKLFELKGE